ncbi:hypothetical protein MMC09_001009 [Bachmanniomyces sp. S44760]|nr:hypothetical protein [Bachmanniomyces sp. S44760]
MSESLIFPTDLCHRSSTFRLKSKMPFSFHRNKSSKSGKDNTQGSSSSSSFSNVIPSTRQPGISSTGTTNNNGTIKFPNSNIGSSIIPTRRPGAPINPFTHESLAPPPAYTPSAPQPQPQPQSSTMPTIPTTTSTEDNPYAFLSTFDTIFLIDDSGSMAGRSWRETAQALATITPICTAHDADGIDIFFLNHPDTPFAKNVTSSSAVVELFQTVRPSGGTPTGSRLNSILKPYLRSLEIASMAGTTTGNSHSGSSGNGIETIKPLNIIVITDGVPSDDVESVIINAARKLDKWDAPAWQVGVQFFQVGCETGAAEALRELDDGLSELAGGKDGLRDIVDTVPWVGDSGEGLNAQGVLKVVLGSVTRRLDRKRDSREWRR